MEAAADSCAKPEDKTSIALADIVKLQQIALLNLKTKHQYLLQTLQHHSIFFHIREWSSAGGYPGKHAKGLAKAMKPHAL